LFVIIFAQPAFERILHLKSIDNQNSVSGWYTIFTMVLATYMTWLVYRGNRIKKNRKIPSKQFLFRRELVADILLTASVSVLSFVTWEKGIMGLLNGRSVHSFSDVWFLFVFFAIAYFIFYLPLRYLYLIEDHTSRQTWRRMLLIFAFLLLRSFFEIIRGG
jgi:magnesium-transporting ATPase (P-type)